MRAEEKIRPMARFDALTGLPSRALFDSLAGAALIEARRDGECLALLCLGLDRFQPLNVRFGRATGDCLLRQVAARLRTALLTTDIVARVGGDVFAVLLRGLDRADDAFTVAEKLRRHFDAPFHAGDRRFDLSTSIGIALGLEHGEDLPTLARNADAAMHRAKATGRDTIVQCGRASCAETRRGAVADNCIRNIPTHQWETPDCQIA